MKFSRMAEALVGSEIVKLGNAINERKAKGEKIYNFTIGDFDPKVFPIPALLQELILEKYKAGFTNYPPAPGVKKLRTSVLDFLKEREGLDYTDDEIMITSGGRPIIYALFSVLVDAGDKVVYAAPSWNNNHYVNMLHAQHCIINTTPENDFMPLAKDVEPFIQDARLICLCTPQNPTGTTLDPKELEKICDMILEENKRRGADEKKLFLLFDQMYWTLTYGETKHINPIAIRPEMKAYTVFVDGVSKAFASTGVRVGWSVGPKDVIGKMRSLLTHVGAWAPMAEQQAVADFLENTEAVDAWFSDFKCKLESRLVGIYNGFTALKAKGYAVDVIVPQAAIYLTVKLDLKGKSFEGKILDTQNAVTDFILDQAKLAVVPFSAFGADKESPWYRISVGTCKVEDIDAFIKQLEFALQKLN